MKRRSFLFGGAALLASSANVPAADLIPFQPVPRAAVDLLELMGYTLQPYQKELVELLHDQIIWGHSA